MITNKTEYLLFILINLAARDGKELISSKKIAEQENIPPKYMPQLMAILSKEGFVDSVRGVNGGVKLAKDPEKISVWDIVYLSDDSFYVKSCINEGCSFNRESCELNSLWAETQKEVEKLLKNRMIADLVEARS